MVPGAESSEGRGISFALNRGSSLVNVTDFSSRGECPFLIVIAVLRDQFRSKTHPPLNLPSDVLGQSPLRSCMDCRGHSSPGRNRSCYEARSLSRIEIKRFPYNVTLLINVTRVEQKGRPSHRQLVHVEQLVVLPQERTEEVRPSSGKTYDLAFFVDTQGFTAEIAR